jgi:hypothetical protein
MSLACGMVSKYFDMSASIKIGDGKLQNWGQIYFKVDLSMIFLLNRWSSLARNIVQQQQIWSA